MPGPTGRQGARHGPTRGASQGAADYVDGDPAVVHGVMTADLYPYRIAVLGKL
jgi:hypothetical protein